MKKFFKNILWAIDYWRLYNFYKYFDKSEVFRSYTIKNRRETTFKEGVSINPQYGGKQVEILVRIISPGYLVIFGFKIKKISKVLDSYVEYYYNPLKQHWPNIEKLEYIKRGNKNNPFINTWFQIKTNFTDFKSQYRQIEIVKEIDIKKANLLISLLRGKSKSLIVPNNLKF
jgi:uncharacterized Rmd1/YagE family protein